MPLYNGGCEPLTEDLAGRAVFRPGTYDSGNRPACGVETAIRNYIAANASAVVLGNSLEANTNMGSHPENPLKWREYFFGSWAFEPAPIPIFYMLSYNSTYELAENMKELG